MGNNREDFFGHLLGEKGTNLALEFLTAHANTLVIAGSEATATFLAGEQFG
jgi:phosphopantothenate synthetase